MKSEEKYKLSVMVLIWLANDIWAYVGCNKWNYFIVLTKFFQWYYQ